MTVSLRLVTRGLDRAKCTLEMTTIPDKPDVSPSSTVLQPLAAQEVELIDGQHEFSARCPSSIGKLTAERTVTARDGLPERCADFEFPELPLSATTYDEFRAGLLGTWEGCVETPWTPTYWVTLTLRDDGTYDVMSAEVLDGSDMNALYYGDEAPSPEKRWMLDDIQASGLGIGSIDITFGPPPHNAVRDDLRHIALMGDQLRFELLHRQVYGPLVFRLYRSAPSG